MKLLQAHSKLKNIKF